MSNTFAFDSFRCKSRKGWANGIGRYNTENEWISYFHVHAHKGQYVYFKYPNYHKWYWFPKDKCIKLTNKR